MKKAVFAMACILLAAACLPGCSKSQSSSSQPETVIVKEPVMVPETVIVTETVFVEPTTTAQEEKTSTEETTTQAQSTESTAAGQDDSQKGITASEILKRAAEASDKQYWVVYYDGTTDGRIGMSSFNALEGFIVKSEHFVAEKYQISCDKQVGKCTQYVFNDKNNTFEFTGEESVLTYHSTGVIGSNCDILDVKTNKTIPAKTQ